MPPLREPPGMRKLMEALNTTNLSSPEVNQEIQSIWTSVSLAKDAFMNEKALSRGRTHYDIGRVWGDMEEQSYPMPVQAKKLLVRDVTMSNT